MLKTSTRTTCVWLVGGGYGRGYILRANRVLIENFNYSMSCFGTTSETDLADSASPSPIYQIQIITHFNNKHESTSAC